MIDAFIIFTKGGVVLWSYYYIQVKADPIARFIKTVLLEERLGTSASFVDPYFLKAVLWNEGELVFAALYEGIQPLAYIDSLLDAVKSEFISQMGGKLGIAAGAGAGGKVGLSSLSGVIAASRIGALFPVPKIEFDTKFLKIVAKCDAQVRETKRQNSMRTFAETKRGREVLGAQADGKKAPTSTPPGGTSGGGEIDADMAEARRQLIERQKGKAKKAGGATKAGIPAAGEEEKEKEKKKKHLTTWSEQKITKRNMAALDCSRAPAEGEDISAATRAVYIDGTSEEDSAFDEDDDAIESEEDAADASPSAPSGLFSRITSSLQNITGNKVLTEDDLNGVLKEFKTSLMSKNVAAEIAEKLGDSVRASLLGTRTQRLTTVRATAKAALTEAIRTILTPKRSIDVLQSALAAKRQGRVFSIVFLGVNGVGKSTNLAKVCYHLKQKGGLKVLIAACDTFRAGAVEQLRTHARCLEVELFERGYGKDAAQIAREALNHAQQNEYDVVLIDTAGRMQDNEPLMRALAKLVALNNPDLILFVGEALVGNDAVDQLKKFNQCLVDHSSEKSPRLIDGILLTKFDTVDDKVGAALSMVYVTGQPIIFAGTGQKYTHLRKLNVGTVVKALLG